MDSDCAIMARLELLYIFTLQKQNKSRGCACLWGVGSPFTKDIAVSFHILSMSYLLHDFNKRYS